MKNKELAQKIKDLRNRKGYSQEELSDKSGLSLRTIQRIENGETQPRGDSLKRLAATFDVSSDDIVDWTVQDNKGYLISLNLSALSFVFAPLLGILIPLLFWIPKKDKVKGINNLACAILNFQITLIIIIFIGFILNTLYLARSMNNPEDFADVITKSMLRLVILYVFFGVYNLIFILVNTFRIKQDKKFIYFPKIKMIRI